uniref:Uncharacterized protein n=1 Tax=Oryza brachyantha TaxID=4533 RepID=J3KWU6_ORYBR
MRRWPGRSCWRSSLEYMSQYFSAILFTFCTHSRLSGRQNTSSSMPRCSYHSAIRKPWIWPWAGCLVARWYGWYPPMAISESLEPAIDLWLMFADPTMMYSSSTENGRNEVTSFDKQNRTEVNLLA